jgi:hypothetical protein
VLPYNEKEFIEKPASSYSNSEFDYSGIGLDETDAYKEQYGSEMEDINNSSRLYEDMDNLRKENYLLAHSLTQDYQNNEQPITSYRLPNYSARYSRFICRNDHDSACEYNKRVLEERNGRFNHLLETDKAEHITDFPHRASNPEIFRYRPSDDDRNTYEGAYSVGTQDFSNEDVKLLGTDSLQEEEYADRKVNYALPRYKNKFPEKEYRTKDSHYYEYPVAGLPGVRLKYNEGTGRLYSMESVTAVDTASKDMHNKAKQGNEVPKTIRVKDRISDFKISGRYVPLQRVGKYDIRNTKTGRSENQQQYYVQSMIHGGAEGKNLDNMYITSLAPMAHRRLEITPGYTHPTDVTSNDDKIVLVIRPKYQKYATEEQYGKHEYVSTNRHGDDRWKRSQTERKSSSVDPTKSYPSHHQKIFPTDTKFEHGSDPQWNSLVATKYIESVTNGDIQFLEPKNKLSVTRLHRNTQYLDDSDKYEGDSLFRSTTEYLPQTYNVKAIKTCKYPVFRHSNEYHDDGWNLEAEEDMGSHQSVLFPANGRNSFRTDNKLNHQTYSDVMFVRNDKVTKGSPLSMLNTILNSEKRNGDQGIKHQNEYDLKCKKINIGEKEMSECFAAQSHRKYKHGQRRKEFPVERKVKLGNHVEDSFLPGMLPLQQNTGHKEGVHKAETSTQNVGNNDIYTKMVIPYDYFNHHRSDRSSGEDTDLVDDLQSYETYGFRGPQHNSQFQTKVGNTQEAADFSPIVKNNAGAEEKPSRPLSQINDEYFIKSIPQHFRPQGTTMELNDERFPSNTINKEHLIRDQIRPSNRIKEEKSTDKTHYPPVTYDNYVNNLSNNKDQADTILSSDRYRKTQYITQDLRGFDDEERHENKFDKSLNRNKDDGILRNLQVQEYNSDQVKDNVDISEDVESMDHWEIDKNNPGVETQRMASKLPVFFEPHAFLKEEKVTGESSSEFALKYDKLNANKGFKISDEVLLLNKDVKHSQGHDYNSRSSGVNLDKPELVTNRLGKTEDLLSPELSDDALQTQIEESIGKMTGKYGPEETNIFLTKNKNWSRKDDEIENGVKPNESSTEKIYVGINSMAEDSEAKEIEFKSKIKLPYEEDKEGRDTIQYNNIHNSHHIPNNLKAAGQSKTRTHYVEDTEGQGKERSNLKHKSHYIHASADVATVHPEGLYEGDGQWQLKNGMFRAHHKGGHAETCDGCTQELRDGRVLKTTDRDQVMGADQYSFHTHINTDGVVVPNMDENYSQVPEYNRHSPGTSPTKHRFSINKLGKTEIPSIDHSDDEIQFQIEESMSRLLGNSELTHTNIPAWRNKEWGYVNTKTVNDIKHNDYSSEQMQAATNSNADCLKSNKIKLKNKIIVPCKKKMDKSDHAQRHNVQNEHHTANNLNAAKSSKTELFYDEGKGTWNSGYEPIYRTAVEDATTTSRDKKIKASLTKGFREALSNSEKYKAKTLEHETNEWIDEHPVPAHNEYVPSRKQDSYNRRTSDLEEQTLSEKFYNYRRHPSSKALLDYKFHKQNQLLGNIEGKERLKTGFENPTAPEHFKDSKFPLAAESKMPPSKTPHYKNMFNLPSHNDGIIGTVHNYNEIKHHSHNNYYDDYEDYYDGYDYDNDYQEAINADNRLYEDEYYEDHTHKVPLQNHHSENYSPNNRQHFYEKFSLQNPVGTTMHDRQAIVSARKHKDHHIGQNNEDRDYDVIATHEKELKHYLGGIRYRPKKNNIQTNSPVSKLEKHIWKGKAGRSTPLEHGIHSSKDALQYKANNSIDKIRRNGYYTSPYIAIKYYPANYHHYEDYYRSEKPNLYQPQVRLQRSTEANPKNHLDSDLELETQIQRPYEFGTSFEIQQLSAGPVQNSN